MAAGPAWGRGVVEVVATSTDLKALVEVVGREAVRVVSLAPAVHAPHAVDVGPGQIARIRAAALLVRVGLEHEPWLAPALDAAGEARFRPGGRGVLDCSTGIAVLPAAPPGAREGPHARGNPHYWLDPDNARPITAAIRDALARLAPAQRARFDDNRAGFLAVLDDRLARWTRAMAPHQGTRIVVMHDAWPYFARRFGLVVAGAVEPAPGLPPTLPYLADLFPRMREQGVRLVVAGPEDNAAMVRHVAARGGARPVTLVPSVGGDPDARSYLALFDLNIARLTVALAPR